jgi:hypothetical protein
MGAMLAPGLHLGGVGIAWEPGSDGLSIACTWGSSVNKDYAPGKAGNNVWGDAQEVQSHGGGGKYNNQLKR